MTISFDTNLPTVNISVFDKSLVKRFCFILSSLILNMKCRGDQCVKSNIVNNLCKDMVYTF